MAALWMFIVACIKYIPEIISIGIAIYDAIKSISTSAEHKDVLVAAVKSQAAALVAQVNK
jgi:hypothetical protein